MSSPAGPYSVAQEAALRASSALFAAMNGKVRIYTDVPANAQLPYIVLGNDEIDLDNDDCADEATVTSTVSWWSRPAPLDKGVQARAMGSAIIAALNAQLTLTGWAVDEWSMVSERYLTDPDQSSHGIATFEHLLTQQV